MKTVLFWDVDGVFVDTEELHFKAWNMMLDSCGAPPLTLEEYAPLVGQGSKDNMRIICSSRGIEEDETILDGRRRNFYKELRSHGIPRIEENIAIVRRIDNEHPEIRQIAVSSARREDVDGNITACGLQDYFEQIISFEDAPDIKRKPAPDIYLHALKISAADSPECVAFEDSANGVASAKAAGIQCVALPNQLTRFQDLSSADLVLDPGDLAKYENILKFISK